MSGWCLKTSGKCMGGKDDKLVENSQIIVMIISSRCFFQWSFSGLVSRVSGLCLEGVWVAVDTYWGVMIPNKLIIFQKA